MGSKQYTADSARGRRGMRGISLLDIKACMAGDLRGKLDRPSAHSMGLLLRNRHLSNVLATAPVEFHVRGCCCVPGRVCTSALIWEESLFKGRRLSVDPVFVIASSMGIVRWWF